MITSTPLTDGFEFYNDGKLIAIGCYTYIGFELCELDDTVTVHPNGMVAVAFLKNKHTPEHYQAPVASKHTIKPPVLPLKSSKRLDLFRGHPALKDVYPLATEKPHGNV